MKFQENIPLSTLTTMRLGGPARYVVDVESPEDVKSAYGFAKEKSLPVYILGGGSNIIGRDEGFPGVVVVDKLKGIEDLGEGRFKGYAGEDFDEFIAHVTAQGYSGMEAMSGVPGTLGAAPVQNVGAYGQEMSHVLESVEVFDTETQSFKTFSVDEMELGYRRSIFNFGPDAGRYFIISVIVSLKKTNLKPPFYNSLQKYIEDNNISDFSPSSIRDMVKIIRAQKLPDPAVEASAGSFFKNIYLDSPEEVEKAEKAGIPVWHNTKIPAGWLIEHAGLKGKEFFGFRVSEKAALILINDHANAYSDLEKARQAIIDVVEKKFGFKLEQEPVEIG